MSSIWSKLDNKYFKKTAVVDDPHGFVSVRKGITADNILNVYNNMDIIGKGVSGDSE